MISDEREQVVDKITTGEELNEKEDENEKSQTVIADDTLTEDSVANVSTEVHLDNSIAERLSGLTIGGDENNTKSSVNNNTSSSQTNEDVDKTTNPISSQNDSSNISKNVDLTSNQFNDQQDTQTKPEKSPELSKSILAGEISDNSECSVDVEEEEASDYVDDKLVSGGISDEEMSIEDRDEDVEEEEEFHEVEEEKHKTSQESVGGDKSSSSSATTKPKSNKQVTSTENLNSVQVALEETTSPKVEDNSELGNSDSYKNELASTTNSAEVKSCSTPEKLTTTQDNEIITPAENNELQNDDSKGDTGVSAKTQNAKNTDWADIMLSNLQGADEVSEEKATDNGETEPVSKEDEEKADVEKKELDLDEDVKNPQYIPKKGVFYEHDDRSQEADNKKQPSTSVKKDEEVVEVKESVGTKKIGTQEKQNEVRRGGRRMRTETDRWNHDLFKDDRQKQKSRSDIINAYGYDIRHERTSRNNSDNRSSRQNNTSNPTTTNVDRQQGGQDNLRSRQGRDNRAPRQGQSINSSRERRTRRPNNRPRNDSSSNPLRRDVPNNRTAKPESKEVRQDSNDGKQSFQTSQPQTVPSAVKRDNQDGSATMRDRYNRNENRVRRQNSKDRPVSNNADDKLPPINTVMPPITTWSNKIEDMVKEEANHKESSPSRHQQQNTSSNTKNRSNDYWPQNNPNKAIYHDRQTRNLDDNRHLQQQQHYNSRRPYQERDDPHKSTQFVNRNHYGDRSNQHHQEWRRNNHHYGSYAKPNEYEPIKTQTFENSRLNQNNSRSNYRDLREVLNERRMPNQQNFQASKIQTGPLSPEQQMQQRQIHQQQQQLIQPHHHHQQLVQQQQLLQHQATQHLRHQAQPQQTSNHQQQSMQNQNQQQQQASNQTPQTSQQQQTQVSNQQLTNSRQTQQPQTSQAQQSRQNLIMNNLAGDNSQEPVRLSNNTTNATDLINSRPIIKTDGYNGANVAPHSQQTQPIQQHSHNHRSMGGPMSQQGPGSAGAHLVPSHMGAAGTQAQYYSPTSNSRDSAAAAAALATYHGYIPGGHSVMDTTRYHMTSQQLSDHGYMASTGQTNDVAAASVMHQQGMYTDAGTAGGTVASSAYLAQAGSALTSSTNIPVTGAGPPPLAPVPYLQHSQYAPPPYSNPYSQPQHNQAQPPQSSHYPYWTYI